MQAEGNVVSLRERDTEAPRDFSVFFSNESGKLFEALYFVTGNRADAAELMQDAFLKLWERWDSIDRINDCRASSVEIDRLRAVTSARDHRDQRLGLRRRSSLGRPAGEKSRSRRGALAIRVGLWAVAA
jgi:DNA-directed RNA polymerase specialized sigma24 family protein